MSAIFRREHPQPMRGFDEMHLPESPDPLAIHLHRHFPVGVHHELPGLEIARRGQQVDAAEGEPTQ